MPTTFWNTVSIHLVNIYGSFTLLYDPDCSKKQITEKFNQFEKIKFFVWAAQSLNTLNFQVFTDNEKLWISHVLFYRQVSGHCHHTFVFLSNSWEAEP